MKELKGEEGGDIDDSDDDMLGFSPQHKKILATTILTGIFLVESKHGGAASRLESEAPPIYGGSVKFCCPR